jgi:hypothetical protein
MRKDEILAIRISSEDLKVLDDLARQKGVSRATMARTILANARRLYNYLEADVMRKGGDEIQLSEDIARQIREKLEKTVTPDVADTISGIMLDAITQVAERLSEKSIKKK